MKIASTVARYPVASRDSSWEPCLSHITSLSSSRFR